MNPTNNPPLSNFFSSIGKYFTIFVFLLLPSRLTNVFVSLSIFSLFKALRKDGEYKIGIDKVKFNTLLNLTYQEDIMMLPNKTIGWFWAEDFLKQEIVIRGEKITIKEAIAKDQYLYSNLKTIISALLNNIPKPLLYKIQYQKLRNRLELKHNVVNLLLIHN